MILTLEIDRISYGSKTFSFFDCSFIYFDFYAQTFQRFALDLDLSFFFGLILTFSNVILPRWKASTSQLQKS